MIVRKERNHMVSYEINGGDNRNLERKFPVRDTDSIVKQQSISRKITNKRDMKDNKTD
jgi:hypothetical protein